MTGNKLLIRKGLPVLQRGADHTLNVRPDGRNLTIRRMNPDPEQRLFSEPRDQPLVPGQADHSSPRRTRTPYQRPGRTTVDTVEHLNRAHIGDVRETNLAYGCLGFIS